MNPRSWLQRPRRWNEPFLGDKRSDQKANRNKQQDKGNNA
jgi:hypothetical protein